MGIFSNFKKNRERNKQWEAEWEAEERKLAIGPPKLPQPEHTPPKEGEVSCVLNWKWGFGGYENNRITLTKNINIDKRNLILKNTLSIGSYGFCIDEMKYEDNICFLYSTTGWYWRGVADTFDVEESNNRYVKQAWAMVTDDGWSVVKWIENPGYVPPSPLDY